MFGEGNECTKHFSFKSAEVGGSLLCDMPGVGGPEEGLGDT